MWIKRYFFKSVYFLRRKLNILYRRFYTCHVTWERSYIAKSRKISSGHINTSSTRTRYNSNSLYIIRPRFRIYGCGAACVRSDKFCSSNLAKLSGLLSSERIVPYDRNFQSCRTQFVIRYRSNTCVPFSLSRIFLLQPNNWSITDNLTLPDTCEILRNVSSIDEEFRLEKCRLFTRSRISLKFHPWFSHNLRVMARHVDDFAASVNNLGRFNLRRGSFGRRYRQSKLLSRRSLRTCLWYLMQFPATLSGRWLSFVLSSRPSVRSSSPRSSLPFPRGKVLAGTRGAINCSYSNQLLNYDSGELVTTTSEILLAVLQL